MKQHHTKYWAVVPAAGIGKRMGSQLPKQYLLLQDKPVLQHTLERLLAFPFSAVMVALNKDDSYWPQYHLDTDPRVLSTEGGRERCDSVLNALLALRDQCQEEDWVMVHDAARPCLSLSDIEKMKTVLGSDDIGGILALPASDTIKLAAEKNAGDEPEIERTVDRDRIWLALTPQMFRYGLLRDCLQRALADGVAVTDEASAVEYAGYQPKLVQGRRDNLKITVAHDLELAEFYLSQQGHQ